MTDNKYDLLRDHLKSHRKDELVMTFDEIEEILGFALPRAAQRAEWWFDERRSIPTAAYRGARRRLRGERLTMAKVSGSAKSRNQPPIVSAVILSRGMGEH